MEAPVMPAPMMTTRSLAAAAPTCDDVTSKAQRSCRNVCVRIILAGRVQDGGAGCPIPATLRGRAEVDVVVTKEGRTSSAALAFGAERPSSVEVRTRASAPPETQDTRECRRWNLSPTLPG